MARFARVVAVDTAHHVTQRGMARQFLLASDAERRVYLDLLRQAVRVHALSAGWRRTSPVLRFGAGQASRSMLKTDESLR